MPDLSLARTVPAGQRGPVAAPAAERLPLGAARRMPPCAPPPRVRSACRYPPQACRAARDGERAALWLGPDEWLLLAPAAQAGLATRLERALEGLPHSLVEVTHRQVGLLVHGPQAALLLASRLPAGPRPARVSGGHVHAHHAGQGRNGAVAHGARGVSSRGVALVRALRHPVPRRSRPRDHLDKGPSQLESRRGGCRLH